ncbi:acylphosphatase [Acrasis kona]|uniref:acylphosphatase n=1 Tax=Acrasis kona TaxID=1008807 RepID=A0AAW2ZHB6_9EUKA
MVRIQYQVFGKVQGVCFRANTVDMAKSLGSITGFVRNTQHNTVEGEAQGDNEKISQFIKNLEKGYPPSRVDKVETKEVDEKSGETSFKQVK